MIYFNIRHDVLSKYLQILNAFIAQVGLASHFSQNAYQAP